MEDITVDQILAKLTISQLKQLIELFGRPKPNAKSTKSDVIAYIKTLNLPLDVQMLQKYFGLTDKLKKQNPSRKRKAEGPPETETPEIHTTVDHE